MLKMGFCLLKNSERMVQIALKFCVENLASKNMFFDANFSGYAYQGCYLFGWVHDWERDIDLWT